MRLVRQFRMSRLERDALAYLVLLTGIVALFLALMRLYRPDIALPVHSGTELGAHPAFELPKGARLSVPTVDSFGRPIRRQGQFLVVPLACGACFDPQAFRRSLPAVESSIVVVIHSRLEDVPKALVGDERLRILAGRDASDPSFSQLRTGVAVWLARDGSFVDVARPGERLASFVRRMQR
ncbi:MAG: hypothetical protein D6724_07220 [Armatimonadetes bacterium]|nr:MAG: hypothetical protein D6724_07220 [Armatimonadota bacterium]